MNKKLLAIVCGIIGMLTGFIISDIVRSSELNWSIIGVFIALIILVFLFSFGLNLFIKKIDVHK